MHLYTEAKKQIMLNETKNKNLSLHMKMMKLLQK